MTKRHEFISKEALPPQLILLSRAKRLELLQAYRNDKPSMPQPPLLPEETLVRVLRLARFDGLGALVLGSFFAVSAALVRDIPFAAVGLLAAGAGAVELHGVALLRARERRGMPWVIASQPLLLLVILSYCALRVTHFEIPAIPDRFRDVFALGAQQWNLSVEDYFRMMNRLTAQIVAVLAVLYQGGMTVYYVRRRRPVEKALAVQPDMWA